MWLSGNGSAFTSHRFNTTTGSSPVIRTNFMEQLILDLKPIEGSEGKCLDPQPGGFFDCGENNEIPGEFHFYSGNEMEGHSVVMTIKTSNLEIEPHYDWDKDIWVWKKISEKTLYHRKWWKEHKYDKI